MFCQQHTAHCACLCESSCSGENSAWKWLAALQEVLAFSVLEVSTLKVDVTLMVCLLKKLNLLYF